jgi:hypothetical protein
MKMLVVIPLMLSVLFFLACEPATKITFENQHDSDVKILVAHVRDNGSNDELTEYGIVSTKATKTIYITFLGSDWVNRIQVQDMSGKILYSGDDKMADLEKIGWKIVISP